MNKKTIQSVFLGMVLLLMYLPILLLAVYSFMDSAIIGRSGSFTVKNYVYLFHSEDLRFHDLWNTHLSCGRCSYFNDPWNSLVRSVLFILQRN